MNKYALAIHGGAGTILRSALNPEVEAKYKTALYTALEIGHTILKNGGTALDAVEEVIKSLEDCPLFNAAKGAVFSADGTNEMESSIMCGKTLNAGASCGVKRVKNPIALSRKILDNDAFVYLSGEGAERYAKLCGLEFVDPSYFYTEDRYKQWIAVRDSQKAMLDHDGEAAYVRAKTQKADSKFGTVGAVALDMQGNIAAGTSTGGLTNKRFGRMGDSSVIGSGSYANNNTCAVSCTGYGEYFLRSVVAYDISCLIEYKGLSLKEACNYVVKQKLVKLGGEGGIIALDAQGNIELCFNSEGMYRGQVSSDDDIIKVAIYE